MIYICISNNILCGIVFANPKGMLNNVITYIAFVMIVFTYLPVMGMDINTSSKTEQEKLLFQKINTARQNPLKIAADLGFDTNELLKKLPELNLVLTKGIPNLWNNKELQAAAKKHAKDMTENFYYSHTSPDGSSYADRIKMAGYPVKSAGEAIGILAFYNFLTLNDAVDYLFEYLIREELDPERKEKRNIFNPEFQEIGISMQSGIWTIGNVDYNIVLVTCNFGTRLKEDLNSSTELFQLLNQARSAPLDYAKSIGVDIDSLLEEVSPDFKEILQNGIPTVGMSGALFWTAGFHTLDMMTNHFLSTTSFSDGKQYADRLASIGYLNKTAGEAVGYIEAETWTPLSKAIESIFNKMFLREIAANYKGVRKILNPDYLEVGIGFGLTSLKIDDELKNAYVATFDFGDPEKQGFYLTSLVFEDADKDGLYSVGEGIEGVEISLEIWSLPMGEYSTRNIQTGKGGDVNIPFTGPAYIRANVKMGELNKTVFLSQVRYNQQLTLEIEPNTVNEGDVVK